MATPSLEPQPGNILQNIANSFQCVRTGPPVCEPGEPVMARVIPPTGDLQDLKVDVLHTPLSGLPVLLKVPVKAGIRWTVLGVGDPSPLDDEFVVSDLPATATQPPEASFLFAPAELYEMSNAIPAPSPVRRIIRATITVTADVDPAIVPALPLPSASVDLPDLSVFIPALGIPTVLALFRHENYLPWIGKSPGAALIMLPVNSWAKTLEDVLAVMRTLRSTVSRLISFPRFALFLLGLDNLAEALTAQPYVVFRVDNEVKDLRNITLIDVDAPFVIGKSGFHIPGPHMTVGSVEVDLGKGMFVSTNLGKGPKLPIPGTDVGNDLQAHNRFSSMIFIGPPTQWLRGWFVECFSLKNFNESKSYFQVRLHASACSLIPLLSSLTGTASSASVPPDTITVKVPREGGFDNSISSVRFKRVPKHIPPNL